MKKKWGGNRRKNFCSEMWGNVVKVLSGLCENLLGLSMCDGPIEIVKYIWVNI